MKGLTTTSLRVWLPMLLTASFLVMLALTTLWHDRRAGQQADARAMELLRNRMAEEQQHIESLLRADQAGLVAEEIALLGAVPEVVVAALVDDNGRVLRATSRILEGRPVEHALPQFAAPIIRRVRGERRPQLEATGVDGRLRAYQPITLAARPGEIRPASVGVLLLSYDLGPARAASRRDTLAYGLGDAGIAAIVVLLTMLLLHRWFARPLAQLHAAAGAISRGDFSNRIEIAGRGELTQLGGALDHMRLLLGAASAARTRDIAALRASEENLSLTLQSIGDAVIATDAAGLITRMNPVAERLCGWLLSEARGRPLQEVFRIIDGHSRLPALDPARRVLATGETIALANGTALIARDGRESQIADSAAPIRDIGGQIVGVVLVFSDVTEKYQVQEALRQSNVDLTRFKNTLDQTLDCVFMFDAQSLRFTYVNAGSTLHIGYSEAELLQMTPLDIKPEFTADRFLAMLLPLRQGLQPSHQFQTVHRHKDGYDVPVEISLQYVSLNDEDAGFVAIVRDISERKRAEAELSESMRRLRLNEANLAITLHSIGDAVIATDTAGLITRMNATAERLTGWPLADAIGRPLTEVFSIVSALTGLPSINPVQQVMDCGDVVGLANQTALLARDGGKYQIADSAAPIRGGDGQIVGVVRVFSDVTEQYRVRAELASTAEMLERTGRLAQIGGWEVDLRNGTHVWSRETCRIQDIEPPITPPLRDALKYYAPEAQRDIQAAVQAAVEHGTPWELELPVITAKGRHIWAHSQGSAVMENGVSVKLVGTFRDISARKEAEGRLQTSVREKEALLNELHHRVKNNLQVITSLLRLEAARSAQVETRTVLTDMQGRIRSMALLHEALYSSDSFAAVDLGTYLGQLAPQTVRTLATGPGAVQLKLQLASVAVGMDQALPCGLLVNELISNSLKHGFADGREGEILVQLTLIEGTERVRLRVSDTGVGLPADFAARQGSSLGLQLVGDLARQIGGALEVGPVPAPVFAVAFDIARP